MFQRDSIGGTFFITGMLCVVCSVVVAATAVGLRDIRKQNEQIAFQREVLKVAGLYNEDENKPEQIPELIKKLEEVLINIDEATVYTGTDLRPETFNLESVAKNPEISVEIPAGKDLAGLRRRESVTKIYLLKNDDGTLDQIILPVRGKGLWSTMWGLLSLAGDGKTVRGLTFYDDGETPGLGGEINNDRWKASWSREECPKVLFNEQGDVAISLFKGQVPCEMENSEHRFEALAGATITTRGVENMIKYWLGDHAYGPLLDKIKAGEFPATTTAAVN